MYLLDTDITIYSLKGHSAVQENLRRHLNDPIKICAVTCMELYYGAFKSRKVASNLAKVRALEEVTEVIPLGADSSEIFGMLKAQMEANGTPLDDFDLAIAACALAHNLILVTNNTGHFKRIEGLRIVNWAVI